MRQTTIVAVILACSLASGGCGSMRYARDDRDRSSKADTLALMTKEDVIALSKAKVADDLIISQMKASRSYFQLSAQDIIDLVKAGVSDKVVGTMIMTDDSSRYAEGSGGYYYYPPYYWYGGYPYMYPWYPSFSLGFSVGRYRPFYGFHGFYGGRGFRGRR